MPQRPHNLMQLYSGKYLCYVYETAVHVFFLSAVYFKSALYSFADVSSAESSLSAIASDSGGSEGDDSSYCPTPDSCGSGVAVEQGPVQVPYGLTVISHLKVLGWFPLHFGKTLLLFLIRLAL